MAVDKQVLEQCIAEAAGDDQEMATFLRERYSKNDALAAKFVGGYMRNADYTKKNQELADQRKKFETDSGTLTKDLETARKALEAADGEKNGILKELAGQRISTAKARELMKMLQEKYGLTDDDLPGMSDLIETRKTGKPVDNTEDLDARFTKFGDDLMKRMEKRMVETLVPELGSLASLDIVWDDIADEHMDLTGKKLTAKERNEILKEARDGKGSIRQVWEDKYQIAGDEGLRMRKRDERLKTSWQSEREKDEADKRSKDALERVTPVQADLGTGPGISMAFKTKFREYPTDPGTIPGESVAQGGKPAVEVKPGQHVRQTGDRGPSGAQRAAAKHLEKIQQGGYGRKTA